MDPNTDCWVQSSIGRNERTYNSRYLSYTTLTDTDTRQWIKGKVNNCIKYNNLLYVHVCRNTDPPRLSAQCYHSPDHWLIVTPEHRSIKSVLADFLSLNGKTLLQRFCENISVYWQWDCFSLEDWILVKHTPLQQRLINDVEQSTVLCLHVDT